MKSLLILSSLALTLLACGGTNYLDGEQELEASVIIEDFVSERLKSPATAIFEGGYHWVEYSGSNMYTGNSYVDSQNGFGATIRTEFECVVKVNKKGTWTLIKLDME